MGERVGLVGLVGLVGSGVGGLTLESCCAAEILETKFCVKTVCACRILCVDCESGVGEAEGFIFCECVGDEVSCDGLIAEFRERAELVDPPDFFAEEFVVRLVAVGEKQADDFVGRRDGEERMLGACG